MEVGVVGTLSSAQKGREDRSCFERNALDRGPLVVGCDEVVQGVLEVLASVSAEQLEHVLAPFGHGSVNLLDILDEVFCISGASLEDRGEGRIEGRELVRDVASCSGSTVRNWIGSWFG